MRLLLILVLAASCWAQNTANTANLALVTKHGGAYFYTSSAGAPTAVVINGTDSQYHALPLDTTATHSEGWTHKDGTGPYTISSVADNGGGTILVTTAAPHGLDAGDYVRHVGFSARTTYRGSYKVLTTPLTTTYTVTRNFEVASDTGFGARALSLRANTGSAGEYLVQFSVSIQCDANTTDLRFELVKNTTDLDNIVGQSYFSTADRAQSMSGVGLVTVADDDVIWMQIKNLTDGSDLKVWLVNMVVTRL